MMPIISVNKIATPVVVQCLQLFRKGVNLEYTLFGRQVGPLAQRQSRVVFRVS